MLERTRPGAAGSPTLPVLVLRELEPRGLRRSVDKVLEQLGRGDFRSADVKKLRGAGLYRAKLDDKSRLLFKIGEHAGHKVLLVLEVVHNHDYASARFLGGGSYDEDDFEPLAVAAPALDASERLAYVHPTSPVLHVLDKPLSFDDAQARVFATPLPLILIGSAGSGKTALTLEKLKTLPGHGLYLTRSSFLVESARSLYFANRYANEGQEVDFLSLAELVETIEVPGGREAGWADFAPWYERMRGTFKLREPHKIYEEIKGVLTGSAVRGAFLDEAEYLALGVRQSIFVGEERRVVYRLFERWLAHLQASGLFDANMVAWERCAKAQKSYDFLVIDEVQDITNVELRLALAVLRDERNFLLCGDANQIVHPNLFSWARVKSLFHADEPRGESPLDRIHILAANYRNTRAVTALANRLLLVKQHRFGSVDRESNYLVQAVSDEAGRVELVADTPEVRAEIDAKTRRSTRSAVIVLRDEDKAEAHAAFSTPLVFSVQEAKGLEYENVVLLNLVSGASREFRECTLGVEARDLDGADQLAYGRARDKTDKSLDAYKFYVNALYVALTRGVRSVLLVEREASHPLFALLALGRSSEGVELARDDSTREEWQREARRLELQGKAEQAEQIRREILDCQAVPWEVLDATTFAAIRARALTPGSRDKAAQQLLFEYAVTCDAEALCPELVAAGFRHARRVESGRAFIEQTHYAAYRERRSANLEKQLAKYGIDFRNPLNETPLMVAARLGLPELVAELLERGADPERCDSAGRTALRVALAAWLDARVRKAAAFEGVYQRLAGAPVKVRFRSRMVKLDPSAVEWFLLQLLLVQFPRLAGAVIGRRAMLAFTAPALARMLEPFPPSVLPAYRRQRAYLSAALTRNEVHSSSPYNRRLFLRVRHGYYIVNPALEIEVGGSWLSVHAAMALPLWFAAHSPHADYLCDWLEQLRQQTA